MVPVVKMSVSSYSIGSVVLPLLMVHAEVDISVLVLVVSVPSIDKTRHAIIDLPFQILFIIIHVLIYYMAGKLALSSSGLSVVPIVNSTISLSVH